MAVTTFTVTHNRASDYKGRSYDSTRVVSERISSFFSALGGGVYQGTSISVSQDPASATLTLSGVGGTASSGTITYSSASGTTTATVNGVAFQQTTGNDSARATALAAAITASTDPDIAGVVTASANLGVVTITAVVKGVDGDLITLAASGTGIAASDTTLGGGVDGLVDVAVGTATESVNTTNLSDADSATTIAEAINTDPTAAAVVLATASGAVVTITATAAGESGNTIGLTANTNTGTAVRSSATLSGGTSITYNL